MGTLKKFWKYFLWFVLCFIAIGLLTNFAMRENYKNIKNYEIKTESPKIQVDEFKVARTSGYIKGVVENDTGEFYENKYLKINLFNTDGLYVGSLYKELKLFHNNEKIKYDLSFRYKNVSKATLEITDIMEERENIPFLKDLNLDLDFKDSATKIGAGIAIFLILKTVIP